jgi:hypothetical protein
MRIHRTWIAPLAKKIVETLFREELIVPDVTPAALVPRVEAIILADLSVEDRINDEVHAILARMDAAITGNKADYRKLFELTKQKIVKERDLIL